MKSPINNFFSKCEQIVNGKLFLCSKTTFYLVCVFPLTVRTSWIQVVNGAYMRCSVDVQDRSNFPKVFCKKGALKSFAKFAENTCARVSFLIKLQAWSLSYRNQSIDSLVQWTVFYMIGINLANLLKKRLWHRCFPVNYCDIFKSNLF